MIDELHDEFHDFKSKCYKAQAVTAEYRENNDKTINWLRT